MKKKLVKLGIYTIVMILLGSNLIINVQPSLPLGLYMKIYSSKYKKGDIVVFNLDKKYDKYYKNKKSVKYPMKKLVADNTDIISIKNNHIYVNEEDFGIINNLGMEDPKLKIEKDCFFLLSKNDYSFDSRYYGQICKKDIKYKTRLVFNMH